MLNENIRNLRKQKGLSQEELDVTVSDLLGETIENTDENDLKILSQKLEVINLKLSNQRIQRIKRIRVILMFLCVLIVAWI